MNLETEIERVVNCAVESTETVVCSICMDVSEPENNTIILEHCNEHGFHKVCCRLMLHAKGKCAICGYIYLLIEGTQPINGVMNVQTVFPGRYPLSGYEDVGTIIINYVFPNGIQGLEHPNPGRSEYFKFNDNTSYNRNNIKSKGHHYTGTRRAAFLPDNSEGIRVLGLLRKCFELRQTFTVGTSITTGQPNCVIWNGVHHKTNVSGGPCYFGYPDSTYFERVTEELKAKGIFE